MVGAGREKGESQPVGFWNDAPPWGHRVPEHLASIKQMHSAFQGCIPVSLTVGVWPLGGVGSRQSPCSCPAPPTPTSSRHSFCPGLAGWRKPENAALSVLGAPWAPPLFTEGAAVDGYGMAGEPCGLGLCLLCVFSSFQQGFFPPLLPPLLSFPFLSFSFFLWRWLCPRKFQKGSSLLWAVSYLTFLGFGKE